MKFADPKSDIAFKKIFGNENRKEILISFLNAVLDFNGEKAIKEITILNPYQPPILRGLRGTIVDVRAVDGRGISFIVEMQVKNRPYYDKRLLYYTSKAYVSQIEKGEEFPRLNQMIFIGILDFEMFEGCDYLTRHLILNTKTLKQEITDIEFNFIELPKFEKKEDELKTVTEKWVYFLKNAEDLELIPKTIKTTEEIVEAFEIANQHEWTKEELEIYDQRGIREAEEELSLKESHEKGIEEGKIGVAKKMLSEHIPVDLIVKCTGLTEKEVKSLNK